MKQRILIVIVLAAVAAGSVMAFAQMKQIVAPPGSLIEGIPFSPGVRSGDLFHVAGTMGTDADGNVVSGGIEAQTRKTIENIRTILRAGGMDLKDLVMVNVYLADIRDFDAMNGVYREFFTSNPPVRATVAGDLMLRDGLIEIQSIAARPELERRYLHPEGWSDTPLPYNKGIVVGDHIFLAGAVSADPRTGADIPGDTASQTRRIMDNAKTLVESGGFQMSDLTVSRVWLTDARDFQAMNEVYRTYFTAAPPTRATTRAALAGLNYKIEIMMWGQKGQKQRLGTQNANAVLSQALKVGNRIYVSGIVQSGAELRGDTKAQASAILTQIQNLLREGGMEMSNVVEAQIWVTDSRNFSQMNEAYKEFFKSDYPARATVGLDLMSAAGLVEIAVIAAR